MVVLLTLNIIISDSSLNNYIIVSSSVTAIPIYRDAITSHAQQGVMYVIAPNLEVDSRFEAQKSHCIYGSPHNSDTKATAINFF